MPKLARPTLRLTLTDIFDQSAPPVVVAAVASKAPAPAKAVAATVPGLAYGLVHKDSKRQAGYFTQTCGDASEEIAGGKLFRSGLARGFDLGVCEQRSSGYALAFDGFLRVPATGLYVFRAQIDGGYRLRIDGGDVLVWDGQHGTTEKAAVCNLAKGDHALEVTYVYDRLPARNFRIDWEGPGLPRQPIPLDALRAADAGAYPVPTVKAEAPGDGTGRVTVQVDARGHKVNRTALYLGQLQLVESNDGALKYEGPLPRGPVTLWSRVIFDENHSVDSAPAMLDVTGKPVDPEWTARNVGEAKASAGLWQTGPRAFQFFGNGMHTVTKNITGDFTATCRIDSYSGSGGEPVNHQAWVGLTAREHGERINWEWGRDFHLVQTARDGLRTSADFSDLGSGRVSTYTLPEGRPWIRIVRQGNLWSAWTSTDGKQWEPGAYQFKPASPRMDVGLVLQRPAAGGARALPRPRVGAFRRPRRAAGIHAAAARRRATHRRRADHRRGHGPLRPARGGGPVVVRGTQPDHRRRQDLVVGQWQPRRRRPRGAQRGHPPVRPVDHAAGLRTRCRRPPVEDHRRRQDVDQARLGW